jgi:hypothetical protein
MTRRSFRALVPLAALAALVACEHAKSSNPLSPTIAGPLPGIEITQPKLLEPGQGVKFKDTQQPLTLLVENASSNGVRPLLYAFQIAVDAGFGNIVFARYDIAQGENGRTSLKLQDKLQLGRTYYWRAWAYDGANTGPMASSVSFDVYPPVTIGPPTLAGPASGSVLTTVVPFLSVRNSVRTGPAGNIRYGFQVSTNQAFTQVVAANTNQPENPEGQTSWVPGGLGHSTTYFWRVIASDGETTSPWSSVWSFTTPAAAPAPSPGAPPPGGSCASRASDPEAVVACRRAQYGARLSPSQAPGLLRAIAGDLNTGTGSTSYGLLIKTSGNNCSGFACDIICRRTGDHWDVFIDGPDASSGYSGTAAPAWTYKGTIDPARCDVR